MQNIIHSRHLYVFISTTTFPPPGIIMPRFYQTLLAEMTVTEKYTLVMTEM